MGSPEISIIIRICNSKSLGSLSRAIKSVINQTTEAFLEIILAFSGGDEKNNTTVGVMPRAAARNVRPFLL